MAKIYRVNHVKLKQLVYKMSTWSLTYQQSVFKRYHAQWQTFLRVLPTRRRQKSTGIDMEQNYVTVTLCIGAKPQKLNSLRISPWFEFAPTEYWSLASWRCLPSALSTRAFQFGQKSFDSIRFSLPNRFFYSIRKSDKFAACTLIFK